MNVKEKARMYSHYRGLGWSDVDISRYATIDLTGKKPAVKKAKAAKSTKKEEK